MGPLSRRSKSFLAVLAVISIGITLYFRATVYSLSFTNSSGASRVIPPAVLGDVTNLVNVFIGTTNGGHVFPGATLPHGMVKAGMDTDSPGNHAGYDADPRYNVTGFSQLHDDGTGGNIPLSNFKLFPLTHCSNFTSCPALLGLRKVPRRFKYALADFEPGGGAPLGGGVTDDEGSPGYFSTNLSTGVRVELTVSRRTALHRYTFPTREEATEYGILLDENIEWRPRIVVDVTNDGMHSGHLLELDINPETGRVTGGATFTASFGSGKYDAFVCVDFRSNEHPSTTLTPDQYGVYHDRDIDLNSTSFETFPRYGEVGALLTFPMGRDTTNSRYVRSPAFSGGSSNSLVVLARVGVSLISSSQACRNAEKEIPEFDFSRVRETARTEWNELLSRFDIDAERNQREDAVLFYSSLYRSHIVPADYSGENPKWNSSEPYYDSLYCNWDTYRTLFPLMSLHDPITYSKIVRSFIDIQRNEGWLPECRGATLQQFIQGGSSGDPILSEFYVKFQKYTEMLNISSEALYSALLKDAEEQPERWDLMGRQANLWKQYDYIPSGEMSKGGLNTRQVSRTLEYSFDDFTIAQVAKAMGKLDDWNKYANRSRGFEWVWNPNTNIQDENGQVIEGIRGFMQPRYAKNDSFGYTDPRHCSVHDPRHSSCFLDSGKKDGFYEGGPIVYSQYVPHDTARLIELQGGRDAFIRRLDFIFEKGYFDSTNEPSQQIPFMYHYANRPGLSTERSREVLSQSYNTSVYGLPGNDDSGAMGSYVAFNMLGLYPLPATKEFLISSPFFKSVKIRNPLLGTTTTISTRGLQRNLTDEGRNIYVKSIKVNGNLWKSNCFISWEVFEKGGVVELELTNDRTQICGKDDSSLPPSLSTGRYGKLD